MRLNVPNFIYTTYVLHLTYVFTGRVFSWILTTKGKNKKREIIINEETN